MIIYVSLLMILIMLRNKNINENYNDDCDYKIAYY